MTKTPSLQLSLLGSPHILVNGRYPNFDRQNAIALLIYLAVTGDRHQRQSLATLFWPNHNGTRAFANLRHLLWVLKKGIGAYWLETNQATVKLKKGYELDICPFMERVHSIQLSLDNPKKTSTQGVSLTQLEEAVALYRDTFLAGFSLRNAPEFDEWQRIQAQYFRQAFETILQFLVVEHSRKKKWNRAIQFGHRWLALDRLHEPAHLQLMNLYIQSGNKRAAIRQYESCHQVLAEELGTTPQAETIRLYQRIKESESSLNPVSAAQQPNPQSFLGKTTQRSLPAQLTPFFGRREEIDAIKQRLENPHCRLLTLTGLGGVGKTRLAVQVAQQQAAFFSHGVCFVPLATHDKSAYLVSAIAEALQLTFSPNIEPNAQLLAYLQQKELLLILDNFEHLLDRTGLILEILSEAPAIKILVTSRENLNLQVEWIYPIQGLPFPTNSQEGVTTFSAVELFVHHACRVCPTFNFSTQEQTAVFHICQLLEGMPLGIELAAALRGSYSTADIASEIERNLDFLTTSMSDMPARHRSLRAIFEHSWNLLTNREKIILQQLSVFRGGIQLETAVQVAQANTSILTTLTDKSLLSKSPSNRYEMHEQIRQFASEQLSKNETLLDEVQNRYGLFFVQFLKKQEERLRGKKQVQAIKEIRQELENVRAAWQWSITHRKKSALYHALNSIRYFYDFTGRSQEGRDLLQWAIETWHQQPPGAYEDEESFYIGLAQLQVCQAVFSIRLSRYEEARTLSQCSLELFREQHFPSGTAFALNQLGRSLMQLGNYAEATRAYQESLAISCETSDVINKVAALSGQGMINLLQGFYDEAKEHLEESLKLYRDIGHDRGIGSLLTNLSAIADLQGEYLIAVEYLEESLLITEAFGDQRGVAIARLNLGVCMFRLDKYAESGQLLEKSLMAFQEIGGDVGVALSLMNLGNVAYAQGLLTEAKEYYANGLCKAKEINYQRGIVLLLNDLGHVCYSLQEFGESKAYYSQALDCALAMDTLPHVMEAFVGLAQFLNQLNKYQQAITVLLFVLDNPVTDTESKDRGKGLLAELRPAVTTHTHVVAKQRAESMTINDALDIFAEVGFLEKKV